MASNVYQLTSLTDKPEHIRILVLNPGEQDAALTGSLEVHSLDNLAQNDSAGYTALSYTWGSPSADDTVIQLQGNTKHVFVQHNLKLALQQLRAPDQPVRLWVDAICISQSDKTEKEHQIPLMGRIYGTARKTVIWLGDAADNSDVAINSLRRLGKQQSEHGADSLTAEWLQSTFTDHEWRAIAELLKRPWFTRMWIVQEALLSKNPVVRCGSQIASLRNFVLFQQLSLTQNHAVPGLRHAPSYPLSTLLGDWDRNVRDANEKVPMYEWITLIHRFQCTVARDRFYALRSLSTEVDAAAIRVLADTVAFPDELICIIAAKHFLTQYKTLLPLQLGWRKRLLLPSWCPDWHTNAQGHYSLVIPALDDDGAPLKQFQACGPIHTHDYFGFKHPEPPLGDGSYNFAISQRLCVRGWLVDVVEYADAFLEFDLEAEDTEEEKAEGRLARRTAVREKSIEWRDVVEERIKKDAPNPYASPDGLRSAWWRTLICNRMRHWRGPPTEEFRRYLDLLLESGEANAETMPFIIPAIERLARRSFFITKKGYLGLGPGPETRKGDLVCILQGGNVPFVLRRDEMLGKGPIFRLTGEVNLDRKGAEMRRAAGGKQKWIGEAYVHGIMQGEYVEYLERVGRKVDEMMGFEVK
jgi:hypothetical protein